MAGHTLVTDDQNKKITSSGEPVYPYKTSGEMHSVSAIAPANLPLLFIVEDCSDVVLYMQAILKYQYRITVAGNG
ncbi:MAG: hypothetical protein JXN62_07545 [Bacteroidales bacterium]|nr:hypothetical protein [Bacteroidales bacterium]